jgi:hypothetical protein
MRAAASCKEHASTAVTGRSGWCRQGWAAARCSTLEAAQQQWALCDAIQGPPCLLLHVLVQPI